MSDTVKFLFLTFLFVLITSLQYNVDSNKTASRTLKYAIENATHDASLALNEQQLAQGKLILDPIKARQNFDASLASGLKATKSGTSTFVPTSSSFFNTNIKVVYFKIFDESNTTFPYTLNGIIGNELGTGLTFDLVDTLNNVSVVAIIETTSPKPFSTTTTTIRQWSVYEYDETN